MIRFGKIKSDFLIGLCNTYFFELVGLLFQGLRPGGVATFNFTHRFRVEIGGARRKHEIRAQFHVISKTSALTLAMNELYPPQAPRYFSLLKTRPIHGQGLRNTRSNPFLNVFACSITQIVHLWTHKAKAKDLGWLQ